MKHSVTIKFSITCFMVKTCNKNFKKCVIGYLTIQLIIVINLNSNYVAVYSDVLMHTRYLSVRHLYIIDMITRQQ